MLFQFPSLQVDDRIDIQKLAEIFPSLSQDILRVALDKGNAIDYLLSYQSNSSGGCNNPIVVSDSLHAFDDDHPGTSANFDVTDPLQSILHAHSRKVIDHFSQYKLSVDRSTSDKLWQSVLCFYKNAKIKPDKLKRELCVEFMDTGEVGIDSGALRREFFEEAIEQVNFRLFEDEDDRRIVKKEWGLEFMYEIAGMLVAHSILQDGPGFPCMSPAMFEFLASQNPDECYPVKDDIPLNIATHELISFIDEVIGSIHCCN